MVDKNKHTPASDKNPEDVIRSHQEAQDEEIKAHYNELGKISTSGIAEEIVQRKRVEAAEAEQPGQDSAN